MTLNRSSRVQRSHVEGQRAISKPDGLRRQGGHDFIVGGANREDRGRGPSPGGGAAFARRTRWRTTPPRRGHWPKPTPAVAGVLRAPGLPRRRRGSSSSPPRARPRKEARRATLARAGWPRSSPPRPRGSSDSAPGGRRAPDAGRSCRALVRSSSLGATGRRHDSSPLHGAANPLSRDVKPSPDGSFGYAKRPRDLDAGDLLEVAENEGHPEDRAAVQRRFRPSAPGARVVQLARPVSPRRPPGAPRSGRGWRAGAALPGVGGARGWPPRQGSRSSPTRSRESWPRCAALREMCLHQIIPRTDVRRRQSRDEAVERQMESLEKGVERREVTGSAGCQQGFVRHLGDGPACLPEGKPAFRGRCS